MHQTAFKSSSGLVGLVFALAVLAAGFAGCRPKPPEVVAKVAVQSAPQAIDLVPFSIPGDLTSFNQPGAWSVVPRGRQVLGNVPFQIDTLVQLWGQGGASAGKAYREAVENLPVNRKFEVLYMLNGTAYAASEGDDVMSVLLHYADGTTGKLTIRYGTQTGDWWQLHSTTQVNATDPATKVVWRAEDPSVARYNKSMRFFCTPLVNPKPALEVKSLDLVSEKSQAVPLILALTTGPAGLLTRIFHS